MAAKKPDILEGRLGQLVVHRVYDHELKQLEGGYLGGLWLNLAIFFLSSGLSFLVALATASFEATDVRFIWFSIATYGGFAFAIICLLAWWRDFRPTAEIAKEIRSRVDEPEPPQSIAPTAETH